MRRESTIHCGVSPLVFAPVLLLAVASAALANSPPVVSNVTASQRPDSSNMVDVYYNLADPDGEACTVWTIASKDGGATWNVAMISLSGDVGVGITPGPGKHIIWDAGLHVGLAGSFRVRVYADDGHAPNNMVAVPGGHFPYQNITNDLVYVPTFHIDKYEVTNIEYCNFLNQADPNGNRWHSSMEITRSGVAGSYNYAVVAGKENHPIRYVNFFDAEAYAAWKSTQTGQNYRLPTHHEWEKAAAWDPTENRYYTYGFHQDTISCPWANYSNCIGGPLPVGSYNGTGGRENAKSYYGCYDMSGNVFEWTSEVSSGSNRVLRGGGIGPYGSTVCQCTYRFTYASSNWSGLNGFRLVLDPN